MLTFPNNSTIGANLATDRYGSWKVPSRYESVLNDEMESLICQIHHCLEMTQYPTNQSFIIFMFLDISCYMNDFLKHINILGERYCSLEGPFKLPYVECNWLLVIDLTVFSHINITLSMTRVESIVVIKIMTGNHILLNYGFYKDKRYSPAIDLHETLMLTPKD